MSDAQMGSLRITFRMRRRGLSASGGHELARRVWGKTGVHLFVHLRGLCTFSRCTGVHLLGKKAQKVHTLRTLCRRDFDADVHLVHLFIPIGVIMKKREKKRENVKVGDIG
jgi:hypothetical protein